MKKTISVQSSQLENFVFATTLNCASGITVSPGINSRDMVIVGVGFGRTPGFGVSVNSGAGGDGDAPKDEWEYTSGASCGARCGSADC